MPGCAKKLVGLSSFLVFMINTSLPSTPVFTCPGEISVFGTCCVGFTSIPQPRLPYTPDSCSLFFSLISTENNFIINTFYDKI